MFVHCLRASSTYLHRGNVIGWYIAQTSTSVYNLPPVFLLDIALQQNEVLALSEAEGLGERGLEIVQGLNHFVAVRSCKYAKCKGEPAREKEEKRKKRYLENMRTSIILDGI